MTIDPVVEVLIEALHGEPGAQPALWVRLVHDFPDLPATQLCAAFHAAADAIEKMFAREGQPPRQATQARALAKAIAHDIGLIDASIAPDVAALGQVWAAGKGRFPAGLAS